MNLSALFYGPKVHDFVTCDNSPLPVIFSMTETRMAGETPALLQIALSFSAALTCIPFPYLK